MAETNSLNGIKAGIFVVTSLALAMAVTFVLLKLDLGHKHRYNIRFSTTEGVAGLDIGSDVRVGGMVNGRVEAILPRIPATGPLESIDVTVALANDVTLYGNAKVLRMPSLLGNSASVNFVSVGAPPAAEVKPLDEAPDAFIKALEGGGMLTSLVGPDNAERARAIIDDVADMLKQLKADYGQWRTPIGETITSASGMLQRGDKLLADAEPKIRAGIDDAAVTLKNAREMAEELRRNGMPKLQSILDDGATAMDDLAATLRQTQDTLVTGLPDLARFLEDSREVAAQLKLASIEVRHSPWKLLYQPKPGEVAHENLYDAARSFAIATDDLRSVSEGLKASVERMPGRLEQDAKFRTELQKQVIDAMTRYEEAQRRLYDVLNAPASQGGEGR
jgi:ABC-type transporter Mla subunit MlaD